MPKIADVQFPPFSQAFSAFPNHSIDLVQATFQSLQLRIRWGKRTVWNAQTGGGKAGRT